MMKPALMLQLLMMTLAADAVFQPGQEYTYHYQGHVLSGIPKLSKQYGGVNIDTTIRLQFLQDFTVLMKLDTVRVFKINNQITDYPNEPLPSTEMTVLTGEQADIIQSKLVIPMKFKWNEGGIHDAEFEVIDEYWSMNVKKGILTLLQVNLKSKTDVPSARSKSSQDHIFGRRSGSGSRSRVSSSVYSVKESDVTGDCETKYIINNNQSIEHDHNEPTLFVSAIRELDGCQNKPSYVAGLFAGVYSKPIDKELIKSVMHTDYVIIGDSKHFMVKKAVCRARYLLAPHGLDGGDLSAYIYQGLRLVSVKSVTQPIHVGETKTDANGLRLVIPSTVLYHDSDGDSKSHDRGVHDVPSGGLTTVVEKKLDELVECMYSTQTTNMTCSQIMLQVTRLVHQMTANHLEALIKNYLRNEHADQMVNRKSQVLLDICSTLPTPELAKMLFELISEGRLNRPRALKIVSIISLVVKPTPELILTAVNIFKKLRQLDESSWLNKMLKQSILLGVGTMSNRLMTLTKQDLDTKHSVVNVIAIVAQEMKIMFEHANKDTEKELIFKSIGNFGSAEMLPLLKTCIENYYLTDKMRLNAIYALRRIACTHPRLVSNILLNVYVNETERSNVRIGAFVVLRNTMPSLTTLQVIAHKLRTERSSQVRTFVYTTLVSLSKVRPTDPQLKQLVSNVRLVLKMIQPVTVGLHDSVSVLLSGFNENIEGGAGLNLIALKSKMSGLPEALIANLRVKLFGKYMHVAEFGTEGKAFESLLRQLVGPYGLVKDIFNGGTEVMDLFKQSRNQHLEGVQEKLKQMLHKIVLNVRHDDNFLLSSYIHLLGNEVQYVTVTPDTVQAFTNSVKHMLPEIIRSLAEGHKVDTIHATSLVNTFVVSTPIGIPLTFNQTTIGLFKSDGHIKLDMPTISEMWNKQSANRKVSLTVDVRPRFETSILGSIAVDLRWLTAGAAYAVSSTAQLPVKFELSADLSTEQFVVKVVPPKTIEEIFKARILPNTFFMLIPTTIDKLPFKIAVKELKQQRFISPLTFEKTWTNPLSEAEHKLTVCYSACGPNWCPTYRLFARHEVKFVINPHQSAPEFLIYKIWTNSRGHNDSETSEHTNVDLATENNQVLTSHGRRTQRKRTDLDNERRQHEDIFDAVTPDKVFHESPMKSEMFIAIGSDHQQNQINAKLTLFVERSNFLKHQMDAQVTGDFNDSWKVKVSETFDPAAFIRADSTLEREEFLLKTVYSWNSDGKMKQIKLKIMPGDRIASIHELLNKHGLESVATNVSRDEKYTFSLDSDFSQAPTPSRYVPVAKELEELWKGLNLLQLKAYTMLKETMDHATLELVSHAADVTKHYLYDYVFVALPEHPISSKVTIVGEFLPWWQKMTLVVQTPREVDLFVDAPFYWNPFLPKYEQLTLADKLPSNESQVINDEVVEYKHQTSYFDDSSRECKFSFANYSLETFDGLSVSYKLMKLRSLRDIAGCKLLLARDAAEASVFSIMVHGGQENWTVTVQVPHYQIEWVKMRDSFSIKINGVKTSISRTEPIILDEKRGESSQEFCKVEKTSSGFIELECRKVGLFVSVNYPENLLCIELSPLSIYHGALRGMCGNYNQDVSDDFVDRSTDSSVYSEKNLLDFVRKHVVSESTCIQTDHDNNEDHYTGNTHRTESDDCMVKEALTIRRRHNDVDLLCTSDEPVTQCNNTCKMSSVDNWVSENVCFTCRTEIDGQLHTRSHLGVNTFGHQPKSCPDYSQVIKVPTNCIRA